MSEGSIHLCVHFHCDPIFTAPQANHIGECVELSADYVAACLRDERMRVILSEMDYLTGYWNVYADQRDSFLSLLRDRRIETSGSYSEPNENSVGAEGLVRNLVYGQWFLVDELGANGEIYMPFDVFGHVTQMPQLLSKAGFRGIVWTKGSPKRGRGDEMSRWMAPDGTAILSRVASYGGVDWGAKDQRDGLIDMLDRMGGGGNDILFRGSDFVAPPLFLEGFSDELRRHGAKISTPSDYFEDIAESEKTDLNLPLTTREQTLYHAGTALSRSELKIAARSAESRLAAAEALGTLAAFEGIEFPDKQIDAAWRQVLYGQHHDSITGTSNDQSYVDLMGHARQALVHADQALEHNLSGLASHIDTESTPDGLPAVVFNPTARRRTDIACVVLPDEFKDSDVAVVDDDGDHVPAELVTVGGQQAVQFLAVDVPGVGYRTYLLRQQETDLAQTAQTESGCTISTPSLTIEVDPDRGGGITSLVHHRSGRDFARKGDNHPLNTIMRLKEGPGVEPSWEMHTTGDAVFSDEHPAEVWVTRSPITARIHVRGVMPDMDRLEQVITLWLGIDRIDVETGLVEYSGSRFIGADRHTSAWGGTNELDDGTPEDRDLFGVIFPTSLNGAQPVYSDRFSHRTTRRGEKQFNYDTHQIKMESGCAVHSVDQWAALSWDVRLEVRGESGGMNLGMVRIIRPTDGPVRIGADDLMHALSQRGVTATPYDDSEPQDQDHLQATHVIAVGGPDENSWVKQWLKDNPEREEVIAAVLKRDGSVIAVAGVALWPNSQPDRVVPLVLVMGSNRERTKAAVERFADSVRTGTAEIDREFWFNEVTTPDDAGFAVVNHGTIATSTEPDGTLAMLLQHSADWCDWATPNYLGVPFIPERKTSVYRYSIVAHEGNWRSASLPVVADDVNRPLIARTALRQTGSLPQLQRLAGGRSVQNAGDGGVSSASTSRQPPNWSHRHRCRRGRSRI